MKRRLFNILVVIVIVSFAQLAPQHSGAEEQTDSYICPKAIGFNVLYKAEDEWFQTLAVFNFYDNGSIDVMDANDVLYTTPSYVYINTDVPGKDKAFVTTGTKHNITIHEYQDYVQDISYGIKSTQSATFIHNNEYMGIAPCVYWRSIQVDDQDSIYLYHGMGRPLQVEQTAMQIVFFFNPETDQLSIAYYNF